MRLWFNRRKDHTSHSATLANDRSQTAIIEVLPRSFEETLSLANPSPPGPPRHLLVFLDGTWNEERTPIGEATPTNVLRMFQEINKQCLPGSNQTVIARYYRGVGSRQDNNAADRMWFGFNGKDEERIRGAAIAGLCRDYMPGDSIYIIGFSRGAACARLLAKDLCTKELGLPSELRVRTAHFANLLTGQIEARVVKVERVKGSPSVTPRIAFLGCWDTVDAFVLPSRFPRQGWVDKSVRAAKCVLLPRLLWKRRFQGDENFIPSEVEKAVHCVAIDETRNAFLPTLMPRSEKVEEVWFPGVHSDVGGGYGPNLLADETYDFMKVRLEKASHNAIQFPGASDTVRGDSYCLHYHGLNAGFQHAKSVLGFGTSLRKIRVLNGGESTRPKIHSSLFKLMKSPNVYAANQKDKPTWRVNYNPYNFRELRDKFDPVDT